MLVYRHRRPPRQVVKSDLPSPTNYCCAFNLVTIVSRLPCQLKVNYTGLFPNFLSPNDVVDKFEPLVPEERQGKKCRSACQHVGEYTKFVNH